MLLFLFRPLRPAICPLRPTFEKLFTGAKVWRKAQKIGVGRKSVKEIDPSPSLQLVFSRGPASKKFTRYSHLMPQSLLLTYRCNVFVSNFYLLQTYASDQFKNTSCNIFCKYLIRIFAILLRVLEVDK